MLFAFSIYAQQIQINGKITDSLHRPLNYANVIATPKKEKAAIRFAISDTKGNYNLTLDKASYYTITVSYLGFKKQQFNILATKDQTRNIVMIPNYEQLREVELTYTPPVIFKKDTITYRTDAFTTGEERKLRDILKKLPAVEVDRSGNVTVLGKKITKVLIENKPFFTGNSKLAIDNIPADAVKVVEVLDNYNEVRFLKGLEDSDDMAMNVRLKENKKKFAFGDVELGGGIIKRYIVHPTLYYYSPKNSINLIGDFNNTGTKSFTFEDYLEFQGGVSKLLTDTKFFFSDIDKDFLRFLENQNFTKSQNMFAALSLTQTINTTTDMSSYGIWSKMRNESLTQTFNDYLSIGNLTENRMDTGKQNNLFGIGQLRFNIVPNSDTRIDFRTYIKASNNIIKQNITTVSTKRNNHINTTINADNISVKQDARWHRKFTKKHTASAVLSYRYQKVIPISAWLTDKIMLQDLIPVRDEESYHIIKTGYKRSHGVNLAIKHYWVLNSFNHIYFTLGTSLSFDSYNTSEYQKLKDNSINEFSKFNFSNDIKLNFSDLFFGVHYKVKKGKVTCKPGLFYRNYIWKISQFDMQTHNYKWLLLPQFTINVEFSSTNKLTLKYNLKAQFPTVSQLADRFTILDFNRIYRGNQQLKNELYHLVKLAYYRFILFNNISYNISASYRVKKENFKNATTIQNINIVSSQILSDFKDRTWSLNGNFKKKTGKYKFSLKTNVRFARYKSLINNKIITNLSNTYSFEGEIETKFRNFPNLQLSYMKSLSDYRANTRSFFKTGVFSAYLEHYFLKNFIFKAQYSNETYLNKTFNSSTAFDVASASMFYQKEDSPWGFEISATNLLNTEFKRRNSFSSILVSDEKTFILPRIVIFKIIYKF